MEAITVTAPSPGSVVLLHSLKNERYNGQRALVLSGTESNSKYAVDRGRCAVKLLEDNTIIAVLLGNLLVTAVAVSPSAPPPPSKFCVKEAPGTGGLGVYATEDIAAGVRILAEAPLFIRDMNDANTTTEMLLALLSQAEQESFSQLYDCQRLGGPVTADGTYETNSFSLGQSPTRSGIFLIVSRFNHSCVPNCYHTWNSNLGERTIHTNVKVERGEELTLTYNDYYAMSWSARQAELMRCHKFACGCKACKVTGAARDASDKRRKQIGILQEDVAHAVQFYRCDEAVKMVEQQLKLMAEEGISFPNNMYTAEYDAFQACKYGQQHKKARVWLQQAYTHCVMVEGKDSPCTESLASLLAQPVNGRL